MANKVLTIKMDEKDIEKLKSYHAALAKAGVITMNVPDEYEYMDEELQEILRGFAEEFLCQADA